MTNTRAHNIAVIAGDGIGQEVIPAGIAAIKAATRSSNISLTFTELPWGCDYYTRHGRMMDADGFERLATFDAIYLGAIGAPSVPDHIAVWDLLLPLRQRFQQYVNLRPMRLLPGLVSPLANRGAADIDMVCVRENSEGEYAGLGGRIHVGTPYEVAEQTGLFTRHGIERILRYGFEVAMKRPRRMLASATKSNAMRHSMVLWDEIAGTGARRLPVGRVSEISRRRDCGAHGDASGVARRDRGLESVRRHPDRHRLGNLPEAWASRLARTSTRSVSSLRCSSRFTARRPTSSGKALPIPLARSGPAP